MNGYIYGAGTQVIVVTLTGRSLLLGKGEA